MTSSSIELWTDGSSGQGVSTGGWGFITNDRRLSGFGGEPETTNQRMELMAAGKGLKAILQDDHYKDFQELLVVSDSRYLVNCFVQEWHKGWETRGWVTSAGEPVKNDDLWRGLLKLLTVAEKRLLTVNFQWIKGHAGEELNEEADRLAVLGKQQMKAQLLEAAITTDVTFFQEEKIILP
jgi:ribonuclease HI